MNKLIPPRDIFYPRLKNTPCNGFALQNIFKQKRKTQSQLSNSLLTFFLSFNYLQPSPVGEKKLIHARGKSLRFPPAKFKQQEGCILFGGEPVCAALVCADPTGERVCVQLHAARGRSLRAKKSKHQGFRTPPAFCQYTTPKDHLPSAVLDRPRPSDVGFNKPCTRGAVSSPFLTSPAGGKIPVWGHCWLSDFVPAPWTNGRLKQQELHSKQK